MIAQQHGDGISNISNLSKSSSRKLKNIKYLMVSISEQFGEPPKLGSFPNRQADFPACCSVQSPWGWQEATCALEILAFRLVSTSKRRFITNMASSHDHGDQATEAGPCAKFNTESVYLTCIMICAPSIALRDKRPRDFYGYPAMF